MPAELSLTDWGVATSVPDCAEMNRKMMISRKSSKPQSSRGYASLTPLGLTATALCKCKGYPEQFGLRKPDDPGLSQG